MMVERALKLRDSLEDYNAKMQRSTDPADSEVCLDDITSDDWEMLVKIKAVLKPLFISTKRMEGNATEGLHGALWEVVVNLERLVQGLQEWMIRLEHDVG